MILVTVLSVLTVYLYRPKIQRALYENQKKAADQMIKTRNEAVEIRHDLVHPVRILTKNDCAKE